MKHLLMLATRSAWNRRYTLGLTSLAIALSVALLLGVERLRHDARASFGQSVSGIDLIVGARAAPVQLMLYAVLRIGEVSNSMTWGSYEAIAAHPLVAWTVPITLGDTHRGFAVVGTTSAYFEHFRYAASNTLAFTSGKPFESLFEAVVGVDVVERLGYRLGDRIVLQHGEHAAHGDKPFNIVGVLHRTGTAVDRSIHISLEAIEALHLEWQGGAPIPGISIKPEHVGKFDLRPKSITAVLIGLKSRAAVFRVQRQLNESKTEPLTAVIPGVALDQLWQMVAVAERALLWVSVMVVTVGLAGLVAVVLASLNERRRELAILRSVGARPRDIFSLLAVETIGVTIFGSFLGVLILTGLAAALGPFAATHFGLVVQPMFLSVAEVQWIGIVVSVGALASTVPAYRAYRMALNDGLTPRV